MQRLSIQGDNEFAQFLQALPPEWEALMRELGAFYLCGQNPLTSGIAPHDLPVVRTGSIVTGGRRDADPANRADHRSGRLEAAASLYAVPRRAGQAAVSAWRVAALTAALAVSGWRWDYCGNAQVPQALITVSTSSLIW